MWILCVATCLVLLGLCEGLGQGMKAEWRLRRILDERVDDVTRSMRPVRNRDDNVTVRFGLSLIRINEIDADKGFMEALIWLKYLWKDANAMWDPSEHEGITTLRMDNNKLWKPDIKLYSNVKSGVDIDEDVQILVYNTGDVLWVPPAMLKVPCAYDGTDLYCSLKFGSWVYDGFSVDVDFYEGQSMMDLSDYIPHNSWDLVENGARRNDKYYPCCPEPYPNLMFFLTFQKRPVTEI